MERLGFASVMAVLRRNIAEESIQNQADFVYSLFVDIDDGTDNVVDFYNGQACRWLNGIARVSPAVIQFYKQERNKEKLRCRILRDLLPHMPDSAMAVRELCDLVVQADNVSQRKKKELTEGYPFDNDDEEAAFIMEVLCLGMQLPFIKQDIRKKQLPVPGSLSPLVADHIFDACVPSPCRWFQGRTQELEQLHTLLLEHSKVFLHGIPGIGKSELAKAYAQRYRKEYTNIIYINYSGDLRQAVMDLDFADDLPGEGEDSRLQRHSWFLRSLREDTLLLIDNFNAAPCQDPFLDVVLKYRCRSLFTTRCRYEDEISLEISELPPDILLELMDRFCQGPEPELRQIISRLHGHTFAVELAARLLAKGMMDPLALLTKLEKEKAALDAAEKLHVAKDGTRRKATYYEHIHSLFGLCSLMDEEQRVLRGMTLMPERGISIGRFAGWMGQENRNLINDLVEIGLIHPKNRGEILLHPMIREVAVEELKPSVENCGVLLDSLEAISLMHGREFVNNQIVFHIVERIMTTLRKNAPERYLLFLKNVFQYMEKYGYEPGMQAIVREMSDILSDGGTGTSADRACLLDCRAVLEKDMVKQIELMGEAIRVLGAVNKGNAHLAANLHSNLGARHYQAGQRTLARYHMEQGAALLDAYGLSGTHDSVAQICNYATLLAEQGEPQRAYDGLVKLARQVREGNSDQCQDYGWIQQLMGDICTVKGDTARAVTHYDNAAAIFSLVYAEEPARLEAKRQEIEDSLRILRQSVPSVGI